MPHERFNYPDLTDLVAKAAEIGLDLPVSRDLAILAKPLMVGERQTPNRIAIQPMEGCDGTSEGRPDVLTFRRYERFMSGGAGLIWFEATAVVPEGRANPRQLLINQENSASLADLVQQALSAGQKANGSAYHPYTILQLTHSGRYSRPVAQPAPIIAHHDGVLDAALHLPVDYPMASDGALAQLVERYVTAAHLAQQCGFDGVDIKCCHRYLLNELLAAYTRPGRFGGAFENRTRLLMEIIHSIHAQIPYLAIWVRLNCYDGHPYPWGWGVDQADPSLPCLTEPLRLIGLLQEAGVVGINVTAGNPYYTPHINRPYDRTVVGGRLPEEHPLAGVTRLLRLARDVKQAYPGLVVIGSGFSWLRQYLGNVAAGTLNRGWMDLAGVGRGAFAYPDLVRDLLIKGQMEKGKVCVTCSRCTQIMRDHGCTGCVLYDREVYGPIYESGLARHRPHL
ncbi:MAG: oxidoreductase [Anaerolineae bacterium]